MPLTGYPLMLSLFQRDMRRRYRSYKRGGQQGLDMVWRNMMEALKEEYEKTV
ncbi:hypothetical protein P13BB106kb_p007 [Pectobacterium phage DU_PP_V]|uniref:Uncharacterized protein n=1 Tax=Pectobacterium phage DU_PP_V TaxID=2041492 RepID=A0A2D2W6R4_9CAUD|nr:hypothetical protein HOS40_gp007 [Pectobacterium phage DU_PP_V]ATS93991.1 hypothetical protein P13BB106kb_p007 [Pectobacterium phage DU_PP_V]